jgi:HD superfamily phosphohydrolase
MTLKKLINDFMNEQFQDFKIEKSRDRKLIRDALTGSMILEKHEVSIIDLPIVQRLRRIHQTGLASFTYPCTTHNRFQHTLGVANIVSKLSTSMREKKGEYKSLLNDDIIEELRIAALLHDVGMGPFSHLSEEILEHFPDIKYERHNNLKFSKAKVHEMLAYFMITSDAFKDVIQQINRIYNKGFDVAKIANMIVGDMDDPQKDAYLADLINGPFDADKLDYMPRDAYFSGLKIEVDVERIAHTSFIDITPDGYRRICSDIAAAHNLEQILFNKVILYSTIYHHHKVRALACMIKGIFEILQDKNLQPDGFTFSLASDFLRIDDYYVLSRLKAIGDSDISFRLKNLENRRLLKRALVISRVFLEDPMLFDMLLKLREKPDKLRELRELIVDEVSKRGCECDVYDVWIDLPDPPFLREPSQCFIQLPDKSYTTLDKIFPAEWWLKAYEITKWRGYVFCPPRLELRDLVDEASRKVFEDALGIRLTKDATIQAKRTP